MRTDTVRHLRRGAAVAAVAILLTPAIGAGRQAPSEPTAERLGPLVAEAARSTTSADAPAALIYANRPIVDLRATVLSRPPAVRSAAAVLRLDEAVRQTPSARVDTTTYPEAVALNLGGRPVIVIFEADIDRLSGDTLAATGATAASRLQVAFDEAVELHSPARIARSIGIALLFTLAFGLVLWVLIRIDRRVDARVQQATWKLQSTGAGVAMLRAANAPALVHRAISMLLVGAGLVATYIWITVVFRLIPYTRPWGEALNSRLVAVGAAMLEGVLHALPGLFNVLVIVLVTRFVIRVVNVVFQAIEAGTLHIPWFYPETAQPTRRILVAALWLFALTVSYPHLPGSDSDTFKGVSVFVGLVVSLGSTGLMSQLMSGLMITYSRALRRGDFVKVGDTEGTVVHLGALSTKVKTVRNEEITIPNAIVVSNATTNFSRHVDTGGVSVGTAVATGYDVPWRQVEAMLRLAAERTPGVRRDPKPYVFQSTLDDFYVRYTLFVRIDEPHRREPILSLLRGNIQDAFNEHGVQIMVPAYESDPAEKKVVPPAGWYAAPATPPAEGSKSA